MKFPQLRVLVPAAVLALGLTACGSASDQSDDSDEPTATQTSEATPEETATSEPTEETEPTEESDAPAASGDLTAPGTELAIGEWATVPFAYGNDQEGVLKVRVTKVDTGTQKDFAAFDKATRKKLKGFTPSYVRIEIEQVSGDNLEHTSATTNFKPITSDGEQAQELSAFGSFEPCDSESFPAGFAAGSGTVNTCVIGLTAGGGDAVVGGMYSQRESDYDSYEGKPVLWK